MVRRPALFRGNIVLEPSLWWDGRSVVDSVIAMFRRTPDYVGRLAVVEGVTTVEGWRPSWPAVDRVRPKGLRVARVDLTGESHETMGLRGFYEGLRALFLDYAPAFRRDASLASRAALDSQYTALSRELGYSVTVPASALRALEARRRDAPTVRAPRVDPALGARFAGDWVGVQASNAVDSLRLEVTIRQRGDTLVWTSRLTGITDPSIHFSPAALYVDVIAPDTIRTLRTDQAKNRYVQTLAFTEPGTLTGAIVLEPSQPPPPGVNLRTSVRLTRR
jgi:hypothetical protein